MLDALVFDLDGTLIDSNDLHARAFERAFADEGFRIPASRVLPEIGKGGDLVVESILGDEVGRAKSEALKKGQQEHTLRLLEAEGVRRLPGATELLHAVRERGLKIAIATASATDVRDALAESAGLDLDGLADAILTDSDVDESKPAPDTVAAAVDKLRLYRGVCGFVGDTPYDALSARRAGLTAIAIANPAHAEDRMRRSGMRARYADPADLLRHLDEALECLSPGRHRLTDDVLEALMRAALDEADAGAAEGEVPIGAVLARADGTVLSRGHNRARATGTPITHAETEALRRAAGRIPEGARDLVLVTTLEPCAMCLGAALAVGVDAIAFAHEAPENGGTERLEPPVHGARWPRTLGGVLRAESRARLADYAGKHPDAAFLQRLLART